MLSQLRIGCAGWTIPRQHAPWFPKSGSHLGRYAHRFTTVEINSSFYRSHLRATYDRWAATVPDNFAFAVKAPKENTHALRFAKANAALRMRCFAGRHPARFTARAEDLLIEFRSGDAATDPPVVGTSADPAGWNGFA
jgi:uncharacterized protein YecE (DUF72 family)